MTEFDTSEVGKLAADLEKIPAQAVRPLRAAMQTSARRIRDGMRSSVAGHAHLPQFPSSITYETHEKANGIEAEIGPDKSRTQGALGNIVFFGTSKNGPVADINAPLDAEAPSFEQAVGQAVEKLFE